MTAIGNLRGRYQKRIAARDAAAENEEALLRNALSSIRAAAKDSTPILGLTHRHYKYPARFSPQFVRAAIETFSKRGSLVLDPYMGGGTTLVEAAALGRRSVGCDLNSLAVFVTRVKIRPLSSADRIQLLRWSSEVVPYLGYHDCDANLADLFADVRTLNLHLPKARWIKKFLGLALLSLEHLESPRAKAFARCVLLNVSQSALNGSKQPVPLSEFRARVSLALVDMISASDEFAAARKENRCASIRPKVILGSSELLPKNSFFTKGNLADLVVTSPPYPGVHMLYHRWQVDGRRETPAPYWIADCLDGHGSSYYNFGSRKQDGLADYFSESFKTLKSTRKCMKPGAKIVQMIAFSEPNKQMPRYLATMQSAGFEELRTDFPKNRRIWRDVPRRNWHAELQGGTDSAREVVLVHTAV